MLSTEIRNGTAILTMSLGKVNAMSLELVDGLLKAFDGLSRDRAVEALIVAGQPRVFSAGIDLKRLVNESPEYLKRFLPRLSQLFVDALNFPKPMVAAISGHAVAGGCVLACTGDYRIISTEARIGIPELRVGVPFPAAGLEIMRWAASGGCFRKMINSGATFAGQQAVDAGLADEACTAGEIGERALRAVDDMRQVPAEIFSLTKRQLRYPVHRAIELGNAAFADEIERLWHAPNTRQSVARYVRDRLN
jgi:enoyl-CoA hydratase